MRKIALLFAVTTLSAASMPAVSAQPMNCSPWPQLRAHLAEHYGEVPIGGGLVNESMIVQVLSAPDGGSFTIVIIRAGGLACMIASGSGWEIRTAPVHGRDL